MLLLLLCERSFCPLGQTDMGVSLQEPPFVPDFPPDFAGSSCWAGRSSPGVSCLASCLLSRGISGILFWAIHHFKYSQRTDRGRVSLQSRRAGLFAAQHNKKIPSPSDLKLHQACADRGFLCFEFLGLDITHCVHSNAWPPSHCPWELGEGCKYEVKALPMV